MTPKIASALLLPMMALAGSAAQPQAVATAKVRDLAPPDGAVWDVSPVFLSGERIAILVRVGGPSLWISKIVTVRWVGERLQPVADVVQANHSDEIYAASDNRVIVSSRFSYLYSSDLKQESEIPLRPLVAPFPRSGIVGEYALATWKVFRLDPTLTQVHEGPGQLLSVADDAVIFWLNRCVRIERPDGLDLGSIPVPGSSQAPHAESAGPGRLLLSVTREMRLLDFSGKEILRIQEPNGWGFRHGWSADGRRLLFDQFTRTVPFWNWPIDVLLVDVLGAPTTSNGETIRVVDARTGADCFVLESPWKLLGAGGSYHADLSPSGEWIVVGTQTDVSIYRLPKACSAR